MKKILFVGFFFLLSAACQQSQSNILRLAHTLPQSHPIHQAYTRFAELVAENSDNKYSVIIYSDAQLGDQRSAIQLSQSGGLEFVHMNIAVLEGFDPIFSLLNLPYIFSDYDHYIRVMTHPQIREMYALLTPKGFIPLTYLEGGARNFYLKSKAINVPADLRGLKIRIQESPTHIEMIERMGGSPVAMIPSEIYTALQQGVIDGAENNTPTYYSQRHSEIAKFYSLTEHMRLSDILSVGAPFWAKLSEEEKIWFENAATTMSAEFAEIWTKGEAEATAKLLKEKVIINDVDRTLFRNLVLPMHEKYATQGAEYKKWLDFVRSLENQ
ncbi:MAG: TRAP transporter substrate-binding protein [Brevinema sp.]